MSTVYAKEAVAVWKGGTAFDVTTGAGATTVTDGDAQVGMSPMEMVLAALVGCTGADVIEILRKKRQDVRRLEIRVFGDRRETHPRVYTEIKLNFIVTGHGVDPEAVRRAIELSETKYCGISAMLQETAEFEFKFEVHEAEAQSAAAPG
jgi:putative redox protein